ncbi:MAG: antitoxin MazE family protein [Acetobacteraceae bacterium]|nr:antitoxin MazE family protein [Acetobacteraceae bacterium]
MAQAPSRSRVQRHRTGLRQRGLRPLQIWIPDTRAAGFASEARRQCHAINTAEATAQTVEWIEQVSTFDEDDGAAG